MLRWDYRVGPIREQYSINLYPYPPTLSKVNTKKTKKGINQRNYYQYPDLFLISVFLREIKCILAWLQTGVMAAE